MWSLEFLHEAKDTCGIQYIRTQAHSITSHPQNPLLDPTVVSSICCSGNQKWSAQPHSICFIRSAWIPDYIESKTQMVSLNCTTHGKQHLMGRDWSLEKKGVVNIRKYQVSQTPGTTTVTLTHAESTLLPLNRFIQPWYIEYLWLLPRYLAMPQVETPIGPLAKPL